MSPTLPHSLLFGFPNNIIIITGADGQLGQTLIKYLLEGKPQLRIVGTVRHKSHDDRSFIFDRSKVVFEVMDLNDGPSIENLIIKYRPRYMVNTAANAFVGDSWRQPELHMKQNCIGVLYQLEAIRKHSPETRYVNMGTSEEFAVCGKSDPQDENTKIAPRSPYGCSKAAARYLVDVYRESYHLYAVQPWCFNFEGPLRGAHYLTKKTTLAVARIARAIKDGKSFDPLEVGNIYSYRSWQAAEDVANGIWRLLNQELVREDIRSHPDANRESDIVNPAVVGDRSYGFSNIGTAKWVSQFVKPYVFSAQDTHEVKEFIELAFAKANIEGMWWNSSGFDDPKDEVYILTENGTPVNRPDYIPLVRINPEFYRPLDVTYLHGDSSAARRELGWSPQVSFDQLVERMVKHDLAAVGL